MEIAVPSLAAILADLPDCRHARGRRHPLPALLLMSVAAVLCGFSSQNAIADWIADAAPDLRARYGLTHPTGPSQPTLSRVFAHLDIAAFEAALSAWAERTLTALQAAPPSAPAAPAPPLPGLALDGKTARGSAHGAVPGQHLLSALAHHWGRVLAQQAVDGKTNEITAAPTLLAGLVLEGRLVTADALLTQREVATQIVSAGGDYLLAVKGNQPTLLRDIQALFAARDLLSDTIQETYEQRLAGGRIEQRALAVSSALVGYSDWPHLAQVLEIWRVVTDKRTGRVRSEVSYAVTSLGPAQASPGQLLAAWRAHWEIENRLHWVRDVTFGEDGSRVHTGHGPEVLAALRNTAIGVLRAQGTTNIARGLRHFANQPHRLLAVLGLAPHDNE